MSSTYTPLPASSLCEAHCSNHTTSLEQAKTIAALKAEVTRLEALSEKHRRQRDHFGEAIVFTRSVVGAYQEELARIRDVGLPELTDLLKVMVGAVKDSVTQKTTAETEDEVSKKMCIILDDSMGLLAKWIAKEQVAIEKSDDQINGIVRLFKDRTGCFLFTCGPKLKE